MRFVCAWHGLCSTCVQRLGTLGTHPLAGAFGHPTNLLSNEIKSGRVKSTTQQNLLKVYCWIASHESSFSMEKAEGGHEAIRSTTMKIHNPHKDALETLKKLFVTILGSLCKEIYLYLF